MPSHSRPLALAVLLLIVACPIASFAQFAQGSIAGVVRDSSGAVLPGVTVEVASPALIERVRSVVTDGTGQYRVVELRPGSYAVTFTLPGFAVVKREGVEVAGAAAVTVNAELRLGSLEETIIVTGAAPTVDVQSARRQEVVTSDLIAALPTARSYASLISLVPSMTSSNTLVGGLGEGSDRGSIGANGQNDGRLYVDGLPLGSAASGNTGFYTPDSGASAQEIVVLTSAGSAEAEASGPMVNIVPKSGGNTSSGLLYADGSSGALQGNNFTQALRDTGLRDPAKLIKMWDVNAGLGGPVRRDRLWYFASGRYLGNRQYITGLYYNKNAGDLTKWTYEPDFTRQAYSDYTSKNVNLRLTWQATARNRVAVYWDEQSWCAGCDGTRGFTTSPEASPIQWAYPNRAYQATWTAPITSRLLLEGGYSAYDARRHGIRERDGNNLQMLPVTEQAGLIPGLTYRSQSIWQVSKGYSPRWRATATYATGAHNMKLGYQGAHFFRELPDFTNVHQLAYRFNNGVPNQLTQTITGFTVRPNMRWHALFVQDQWTVGRVTLQGGIRYDFAESFFPEQRVARQRFVPAPIVFSRQDGVEGFHDFSPRIGVAYDVFGKGKTAFKAVVGRYLVNAGTNVPPFSATNPILLLATRTTRSWTDRNGDFAPDCDLTSPAANGECGPWANQAFGQTRQSATYDPALLKGWGVRPGDWFSQVSIQQELFPRVSALLEYTHRWFFLSNQHVTDNVLVSPSDFNPYSIIAPAHPRLPGGGGYAITGLYDIAPTNFGQTQNVITDASNFGEWDEYWQGLTLSMNARLSTLTLQGGLNTGRRVTDTCDVTTKIDDPSPLYCRTEEAFQTQVKAFGAYTLPKIDVQVSATLQSRPGPQLLALWDVPTSVVAETLGRPLSGGERNVRVNLIAPGTMFGDRVNQVDIRVSKLLRVGAMRARIGVDLYNALNVNPATSYIQVFGPRWLRPTEVLPARFAKISGQIDF